MFVRLPWRRLACRTTAEKWSYSKRFLSQASVIVGGKVDVGNEVNAASTPGPPRPLACTQQQQQQEVAQTAPRTIVNDNNVEEQIVIWGKKPPHPVSLKSLVEVGIGRHTWLSSIRDAVSLRDVFTSLNAHLNVHFSDHSPEERGWLRMAIWLHHELPVRLARGIVQLDQLDLFREAPDLRQIRHDYVQSFMDIMNSPLPSTTACEKSFVQVLEKVRDRHQDELLAFARGLYQLRARLGMDVLGKAESFDELHKQLDSLHMKRIALRILIGHYLALHLEKRQDYVGIVCLRTRVKDVIDVAVNDARWICKQKFGGRSPKVEVVGEENLTLPIIPEHLYYITLELVKNSLRAVSEKYYGRLVCDDEADSQKSSDDVEKPERRVPPIVLSLSRDYSIMDGQQVVFEVRDEGGGIPVENLDKIFCYLFTTAEPEVQQSAMGKNAHYAGVKKGPPLAGLGYGLSISRIYAQYFGGEITVVNNRPGQGCSFLVTLSKGGDRREPTV